MRNGHERGDCVIYSQYLEENTVEKRKQTKENEARPSILPFEKQDL